MATLEGIHGGSLTADFGPALGIFRQGQERDRQDEIRRRAEEEQIRQQEATQRDIEILTGTGAPQTTGNIALPGSTETRRDIALPEGGGAILRPSTVTPADEDRFGRLGQLAPEIGAQVRGAIESDNVAAQISLRDGAEQGLELADSVSSKATFSEKQRELGKIGQEMASKGESLDRILELSNLNESQLDIELQKMQIVGKDIVDSIPSSAGLFDTPDQKAAFMRLAARNPQAASQILALNKQQQAAGTPATGRFSKGTGVIVRLPDGTQARSVPILNQQTGQIENRLIPLGGAPISRLGETGQETTARAIQQAGGVAGARLEQELEQAAPIATETARGRATEARTQGIINRGLDAADTVPILNRSIQLLDSVETGGFDRAALAAKQFFGIESANEAELSANLGKTVLSQLRSTFGAAFTEREGARLATIEAGFGKSVEGNRRLLVQTKRIAERAANRAIKTAEKAGDQATADEIREAMVFSLDPAEQPAAAVTGKPVTEMTDEELLRALGG